MTAFILYTLFAAICGAIIRPLFDDAFYAVRSWFIRLPRPSLPIATTSEYVPEMRIVTIAETRTPTVRRKQRVIDV